MLYDYGLDYNVMEQEALKVANAWHSAQVWTYRDNLRLFVYLIEFPVFKFWKFVEFATTIFIINFTKTPQPCNFLKTM